MSAVSVPVKLRTQVLVYWLIALVACVFAAAFGFAIATQSPFEPLIRQALIGLLSLPALWLCARAIGETLGWLWLGSAALELPQPLQVGVPQQGQIVIGRGGAAEGISVLVRCQTVSIQQRGGKTETSVATRWTAPVPFSFTGTALALTFDLPADQPPSEPPLRSGTYHRWRLDVKKPGFGGFDFSLDLAVGAAPPEVLAKLVAQRQQRVHALAQEALAGRTGTAAAAAVAEGLLPSAITVDNGAQGLVLDFAPGRYGKMALSLLLFGALFSMMVVLFVYLGRRPGQKAPPLIFHFVFGLFGGGMLAGGFYMIGQRIRTAIDAAGVHTRRSWFFLTSDTQVAARDIREVSATSTMSSGETRFYTLRVLDYNGRWTTIGNGIPGEYGAQYLREVAAGKLGVAAGTVTAGTGSFKGRNS